MELSIKKDWNPCRYSEITSPYKNEVVMLRGRGCFHSKCTFCDYFLDKSKNVEENFVLNKAILDKVCGKYGELEVICSGSFQELDKQTLLYIKEVCKKNQISNLSLECHYAYRNTLQDYIKFFDNINVSFRVGIETFDVKIREELFNKNMGNDNAEQISKYFDYCNLIVGIKGQTKDSVLQDIELANKYFKRVCIGVFEDNSTKAVRDDELALWFIEKIRPKLSDKFLVLLNAGDYPLGDGCMSEVKNVL